MTEGSKMPKRFYSKFEFERMLFTQKGEMKGMTLDRQKMLLLTTLIMRILLLEVIKTPWSIDHTFPHSKMIEKNIKVVISIIYYTLKAYIEEIPNLEVKRS